MQEKILQQQKPMSPEDFFSNKIEIYRVSKNNFLKIVKEHNPSIDESRILQAKGTNFDMNGKRLILLRTDVFPEEYMPYLEIHEKWEAYIASKDGFNLWHKAMRKYKNDKGIDNMEEEDIRNFLKEVQIYNYDFRHEYAIYKEYQEAVKDGKLDEYHEWLMNLRSKEKLETTEDKIVKVIENDVKIRESIYRKLKEGTPHVFTRN